MRHTNNAAKINAFYADASLIHDDSFKNKQRKDVVKLNPMRGVSSK